MTSPRRTRSPFIACRLWLLTLCVGVFAAENVAPEPFTDGARYGAIGDSITHNGSYLIYLDVFYHTRFPTRRVEMINLGISGDSAGGVLRRFPWDIATRDIDVATVMLGMNDVGRDLYKPGEASPETEARRRRNIDGYEGNVRRIVEQLRKQGVKITLITPSVFDDTSTQPTSNLPGVNRALAECADRVRKVAAEHGLPVVDIHGPMTRLSETLQAEKPTLSVVGADRIHPGPPGHLAMTYWMLKGQGVPGEVAVFSIDAAAGRVEVARNCTISELDVGGERIRFGYMANSLPFPVQAAAKVALDWVPWTEELNRELVRIRGLAQGDYALAIDGEIVRTYSSDELAAGVNLAMEAGTPQFKQAHEVLALCLAKGRLAQKLRTLVMVEIGAAKDLPRPVTLEQIKPLLDARLQAAEGKPWKPYIQRTGEEYLNDKPREEELRREVITLEGKIREASQTKLRRIEVTRVEK